MSEQGRVLLVEDEALIAMQVESVLESFGFEVVGVATTFNQAISLCRNKIPDLCLMDINISGAISGIETALEIRELFGIGSIFLTAYSDIDTIESAARAEPLGYVTKPIAEAALRAAMIVGFRKLQLERKLNATILELQRSLKVLEDQAAEIRELSELLRVCAWCSRINDAADGKWKDLFSFVSTHLKTKYTHGICPECRASIESKMDEPS